MSAPQWMRFTGQKVSSNSPAILSGIAVAGVITTAILAIKVTPKADRILDAFAECEEFKTHQPTKIQEAKQVWKLYIPAAITGAATIACIIGANQIGARRNAALLGAYTIADTAFREYKDEVVRQIGASKERKVNEEVQQRRIDENPVKDSQVIITGGGDQMCYDSLTGRYFRGDIEGLRRAENEVNRRVLSDMYASHNEWYELVGLAPAVVGDELGWNIDNLLELVFTSHLASNGQPCLAVGYARLPRKDYGKF